MSAGEPVFIAPEAAKSLAIWKAKFSHDVFENAQRLATAANGQGPITLLHYQQAAQLALTSLAIAIQAEANANAKPKAA